MKTLGKSLQATGAAPAVLSSTMKFTHIFILCWGLFSVGCATQQKNVVRQTLQSYQVGVTKFKDFKRDARLIDVSHQTSTPLQSRSYSLPPDSPWKLYGKGEDVSFRKGTFSHKWKFVVGDAEGAVCALWFDSSGTLVDISTPELP